MTDLKALPALGVALLLSACDSSAGGDAGPVDAPPSDAPPPIRIECRGPPDCGEPEPGEWSGCEAEELCAVTGERSREVVEPTCEDNVCGTATVTEVEACPRQTDGIICQDDGEICGKPIDCHVCQGGACVHNAPHYDASCAPSCGALGILCDSGSECCDLGGFCPFGELAPSYDCFQCCALACN